MPVADPPIRDVIIIGAGLAGLSAARRLRSNGASVTVLEARGRIGGRVHSERLGVGVTIDLGAQFIGDAQKRVSALVDEVGLKRVAPYMDGKHIHLATPGGRATTSRSGTPLSLLARVDAMSAMWRFERRLTSYRSTVARTDDVSAARYMDDFFASSSAAAFLKGHLEAELCAPLSEISAYELLDQAASVGGFAGEQASAAWFLAEGAGPLALHLADTLGDAVALNAPVTAIASDETSVTVEAATRLYRARRLVVAVPPQLFGSIGLLPLLPETRRRVIERYRQGGVVKTMLVFDECWWRGAGLSGRIHSPGSLFNATMDASPRDAGVGLLVLFSTGASAARLRQAATEEAERVSRARSWLEAAMERPIPAPIAARSVDWNSEKWSLGGYASRRGVGGWRAAPDLFAPLPLIDFAGTETATEWRSFMEGALQSGERAAEAARAALAASA
ncbi:MAG: FAD-dependent oxidoreductase [Alphaproteobacteria bacterium]|nr:FAD-dependent oxidoreductase [Alphaproteobacteria bacterium]